VQDLPISSDQPLSARFQSEAMHELCFWNCDRQSLRSASLYSSSSIRFTPMHPLP